MRPDPRLGAELDGQLLKPAMRQEVWNSEEPELLEFEGGVGKGPSSSAIHWIGRILRTMRECAFPKKWRRSWSGVL